MKKVITLEERLKIERQNRLLLEEELLDKRLEFRSRPYEAHIQYSNFCNMSCVMCYNGDHPPVARMSPELLTKIREQIAPHLSVVIPYDGSEPLLLTWDEARDVAEQYSIDLRITTNVQFLDEQKFDELKGITETLFLSIDSHNREIFERIRPGSKPDKVFENVATTARLSREHGVECIAQVVFMVPNAPLLPETVAYLADLGISSVNVLQLLDINGQSGFLDPMLHLSADYVEWIKQRCIEVARDKGTRFMWGVGGFERHDFREQKVPPQIRKDWNVRWDNRMRHLVPGYCMNVYDRLQVHVNGLVDPCAYATDGDLRLGSLLEQDFDEIWNGPNARDLRRAMVTWDYPSLCKSCQFTDPIGPESYLPLVADVMRALERPRSALSCTLEVVGPEHMARAADAPRIAISEPSEVVSSYYLAVALGGEKELELRELEPVAGESGDLEFEVPEEVWSRLRTNLGYWWAIFGLTDASPRVLRTAEIRCLIRHEEVPRISGSTLSYPDEGRLPVVDLGGHKQAGWQDRAALPARPALGERRLPFVASRRAVQEPLAQQSNAMPMDEYLRLVKRIRVVVAETLPADATIAVVSKGDDALLELDCAEAWHFPASADGGYAGYNPPDSSWGKEQLEAMRLKGADYLVFPATTMWWLTHYQDLADYIWTHYPAVVTDGDVCTIFAIGATPALYGRERDGIVNAHLHSVNGA